jgi:hypothetical protein
VKLGRTDYKVCSSPGFPSEEFCPDLHQNPTQTVFSDAAAHSPESIAPMILLDQRTRMCLQQSVAQRWLQKLLPYQLSHHV